MINEVKLDASMTQKHIAWLFLWIISQTLASPLYRLEYLVFSQPAHESTDPLDFKIEQYLYKPHPSIRNLLLRFPSPLDTLAPYKHRLEKKHMPAIIEGALWIPAPQKHPTHLQLPLQPNRYHMQMRIERNRYFQITLILRDPKNPQHMLHQTRRLRSNQLNYFDNPYYGVLLWMAKPNNHDTRRHRQAGH